MLLMSIRRLVAEIGLSTVRHASRDVHLLLLARFLRMFAYGSVALVLALFFAALDISDERIGIFMTLTLLGDVAISLMLTLVADSLGRRRILLFGAASMTVSGIVFAWSGNYWVLLLAAIFGVISPSGNEIGPFRAVEESTLAHLTAAEGRSDVFAWYVVLGTIGTSVGMGSCGWIIERLKSKGWEERDAYRVTFCMYAGIGVLKGLLTLVLSSRCEAEQEPGREYQPVQQQDQDDEQNVELLRRGGSEDDNDDGDRDPSQKPLPPPPPPPSPPPKPAAKKNAFSQLSSKTRGTLLKLCLLFSIDSLASGMVPYSLINFYLDTKFHLPKSTLGSIVSATWFISSISNIFSSAISKRIGLVKTMVFTHLPSAIFLALLPSAQSIPLTIIFLVARGALASMDQAPRTAFLAAVVLPTERTAVMGIVNVVKTLSQSGGPTITGWLAGKGNFWIAFVVAGALKTVYDLGLLVFFLNSTKLQEGSRYQQQREQREPSPPPSERPHQHSEFELGDDDDSDLELRPVSP